MLPSLGSNYRALVIGSTGALGTAFAQALRNDPQCACVTELSRRTTPGFTLEDCDRIKTDNTAHTVTWKGKSDLSALKGKAVYLRFYMKKAGLYSFQIGL